MNRVTLIGRIGKLPEMITTKSGEQLAKFSIATSRKSGGEEKTSWHNCICFKKTAENVGKYLGKGSLVAVEGEISYSDYVNKEGVKIYKTEIIANSVQFLSRPTNVESVPVDDAASREIPF